MVLGLGTRGINGCGEKVFTNPVSNAYIIGCTQIRCKIGFKYLFCKEQDDLWA